MIILKKFLFSIWFISLSSNLKLSIDIFILSVIYISIDFILGKSKLIKHKLWSVCRSAAGRLLVTLRKKNVFNEQKMLQTFF